MWSLLLLLMGVCLRMNQRLNLVSPLLSPQFFLKSTTWQVHNLAPLTPKLVPSTPLPGPSGVRRKRDCKTYMSTYRQNLSRQKKSAIKSRDRQPKKSSEASPVNFNITGKRSGRSKPPLPASPSGFANYVTGLVDSATPQKRAALSAKQVFPAKRRKSSASILRGRVEGLCKKTGSCSKNSFVLRNAINSI